MTPLPELAEIFKYSSEAFSGLLCFKTAAFLRRKQKVRIAFFMAEVVFWLCGWNIIKSRQIFVRPLAVGSRTSRVSAQVDPWGITQVSVGSSPTPWLPGKKEKSPKEQRQETKTNTQKTPHSQRGTLKQQGPSDFYQIYMILILDLLPLNLAFSSHPSRILPSFSFISLAPGTLPFNHFSLASSLRLCP